MPTTMITSVAFNEILETFNQAVGDRSISEMEALSPTEIKEIIQKSQLAGLIVPREYGGQGIMLHEAIQVIQLVAEKAPAMSIMLCMHYHVVITLALFTDIIAEGEQILQDIGKNNALVASAFAEGVPGRDIFTSTVYSMPVPNGIIISGSKKPCTMTTVADYYATSIVDAKDENISGIAFVKNGQQGLITKPFWPSELLKGADSNQVIFDNVMVADADYKLGSTEEMSRMLTFGLAAFNLMISSAYLGVATKLSKKLPPHVFAKKHIYVDLYGYLLQAHYSNLALAIELLQAEDLETVVNQILVLRYRNQRTIKDIVATVCEHIGGMNYLKDSEVAYLSSVANFIAFHPVNRAQFEAE